MSWFPLPHGKGLLAASVIGLVAWLAVSNWGYRKELQLTDQRLSTEQLKNSKQAGLIATLQAQDRVNRALVAAQQRQEQQLRQQHDAYQRKYREAIKKDPCAGQPLPAAVLELLRPATGTAPGAVNPPSP
ncbi:hypothetical protein [Serratia ureilytica]|uniref:hypothetical protein n=1 Tax=Serratia ureilytica TaxID=300181 RepID=UPI0018D762F5|nr:hypothetical protein [Serratia ureilytica]MBH2686522.1 hypothetical protein [Serratia ureilytica]